eukprot:scaffold208_cov323-Pavlova_lutheri.AAC.6
MDDDGGVVPSVEYCLKNTGHPESSIHEHDICIGVVLGDGRVIRPSMNELFVLRMSPVLELSDVDVYGREVVLSPQGLDPVPDFAQPLCGTVHGHDLQLGLAGHDFGASTASEFQVFFRGGIGHHTGEEFDVELACMHGHCWRRTCLFAAFHGLHTRHAP